MCQSRATNRSRSIYYFSTSAPSSQQQEQSPDDEFSLSLLDGAKEGRSSVFVYKIYLFIYYFFGGRGCGVFYSQAGGSDILDSNWARYIIYKFNAIDTNFTNMDDHGRRFLDL